MATSIPISRQLLHDEHRTTQDCNGAVDRPVDTWIARQECKDEATASLELLIRARDAYLAAQRDYWRVLDIEKLAVDENVREAK